MPDFKYSIIEDFHAKNDATLLDKAKRLTPILHSRIREPKGGFQLKERYSSETEPIVLSDLPRLAMGKGENLCLDFGTHYVGYVTIHLDYEGSHPDAPAYIKLKFAETFKELAENSEDYDGWLSRSWIQEEYLHVDELPATIQLPRRYAFRYMKVTMMDTSPKYKLVIRHAEVLTKSAVNLKKYKGERYEDPMLDRMNKVALRTLANCMQEVFEDGPKRDQRLWLGDLRLQALSNYESFQHYDLVKRCLYLFAGSRFPDGRISACVFTKPMVEADDTYMYDYALFYVVALVEYLEAHEDAEALEDLYPAAIEQVHIALTRADELRKTAFIDWCNGMDKNAAAQAILVYALRYAIRLAAMHGDTGEEENLKQQLKEQIERAQGFWDEEQQAYLSNGQATFATQVWMILAGIPTISQGRDLLLRRDEFEKEHPMNTPYMHHQHIMALMSCGMKEEALEEMKAYWGSMLEAGADTFWEAWNPKDPEASPYGGAVVNSYCHAWSCTPIYLLKMCQGDVSCI